MNNHGELTQLFYNHVNSLSSRLHKEDDTTYFAYAQWPDNETRETGFSKLPETSNQFSTMMQESCDSIETLHAAEVVDDLLKINWPVNYLQEIIQIDKSSKKYLVKEKSSNTSGNYIFGLLC